MKYLFFGTPEFAAIILDKLIKSDFVPEAVVCNPDKPVGRKKVITPPAVKARIMNYESGIRKKIKIWQPRKLEIRNWKLEINKLGGVDFAIVAAYNKIIPKIILDSLPAKFIGIHPSLLPKYRGPSPIQAAILNGDEEVGATLYLMDEKIDSGPILAQRELENYESRIMNYGKLTKKLAELSADLLIEFLRKLNQYLGSPTSQKLTARNIAEVGLPDIKSCPQNEAEATYTKKFRTEDGHIKSEDLKKAQEQGGEIAVEIDRKIRALNPEPGTYTLIKGKRIKILEAKIEDEKIRLITVQPEGKKPMAWKNFENSLN